MGGHLEPSTFGRRSSRRVLESSWEHLVLLGTRTASCAASRLTRASVGVLMLMCLVAFQGVPRYPKKAPTPWNHLVLLGIRTASYAASRFTRASVGVLMLMRLGAYQYVPRYPQGSQKKPQTLPKRHQDTPRLPIDTPKTPQDTQNTAKTPPKRPTTPPRPLQDHPKIAPRCLPRRAAT